MRARRGRTTHRLTTTRTLRVETELGPVGLPEGAKLSATTRVADELVLADLARPLDADETDRLCRAIDALDRANV